MTLHQILRLYWYLPPQCYRVIPYLPRWVSSGENVITVTSNMSSTPLSDVLKRSRNWLFNEIQLLSRFNFFEMLLNFILLYKLDITRTMHVCFDSKHALRFKINRNLRNVVSEANLNRTICHLIQMPSERNLTPTISILWGRNDLLTYQNQQDYNILSDWNSFQGSEKWWCLTVVLTTNQWSQITTVHPYIYDIDQESQLWYYY